LYYGGINVRPINDVIRAHNATNARPGCQKKRLIPEAFIALATARVQINPITIVKKKGGK
jgi:hypothetical protein